MVCYNWDTSRPVFPYDKNTAARYETIANMNEDTILLPTCWVVLVCADGTLQLDKFEGQEEVELSNNIP